MFFIVSILSVTVFLLIALHWYQTRSRFALLINRFPMFPRKLLIGHITEFSRDPEIAFARMRKITKSFKETFTTWSLYYGGVHIVTAEDAEIILKNVNYIKKGLVYNWFTPWLCNGLVTSSGEKWQHRRKILTPTFHFNILRSFVEIFGEHSIELINALKKENGNEPINIIPIITHEALSSICETAMGTKLSMNDKKDLKYLDALNGVISTMIRRILNPFLYTDFIFFLSPIGILQKGFLKTLHNFTTAIINEREENFQDVRIKNKRLAMLDLLISAKKNHSEIDFEGIREEVDTFMFGGHDTTAIGICMALMLLAHHEDVQIKIIKELDDIFGTDDRPASYEDLIKMKYLELCIKESLRLYPSVPLITRNNPIEIQLTNNTAPADCEVLIHIYDIHRNEKHFPDPEKFDPDRFLPENCKGRHPYAYIPFSAGPRNCIGQKYALLELKSFISAIFRNFTLKPVTKFEELRWNIDLVLRVNGPINVMFISRTL